MITQIFAMIALFIVCYLAVKITLFEEKGEKDTEI